MSNNTKKRAAVVGYGSMGSWHIRHMQGSDVVTPAGIYDIKPERCALAEENKIHVYKSFEDLLADETVEIVVVATPNDLHKPQTIAALSAGKHVICEKPVTVSSADLQEMIDASVKYNRLFTVHQNRRWDCDYLMIKQVYASGELGEVTSIESRIHGSRGIPGDWRRKREHGGGMLLDWGVHLIDQMLGIVYDRKLESLYCRLYHITNQEVDDGFRLELYFEGGLVALIEVGTSNFISMPRFYITGINGSAIINDWRDECRVVSCRNRDEQNVTPVVTAAGITRTMAPRDPSNLIERFISRPESDVHDFYRNFVRAIDGKEKQIVTHAQVMRVMRIMEAAFESDKLRRPVDFNDN
ncbi:MAG: Gfo/Idh/MocA family oxidoreductase [Clostridiales bacterium]|nr:Gfo/Idh/MocA family oxidoreductase [Clostridiales bacterium]